MHDLKTVRGAILTQDVLRWVTGQMVDHVSVAVLRCNFIGFFLHHVKIDVAFLGLRNTWHHLFWKMDKPTPVNELKEWHQEFNSGLLGTRRYDRSHSFMGATKQMGSGRLLSVVWGCKTCLTQPGYIDISWGMLTWRWIYKFRKDFIQQSCE